MYEIRNGSYIQLDYCFTYELCSVSNIRGVIYATCSMGAVRIVKYKEENCLRVFLKYRFIDNFLGSRVV